jgi:hypothetical protein
MARDHEDGELWGDGVRGDDMVEANEFLQPLGALRAELDRPSLALRLRVSAHRRLLDEELARGADPLRSAALALRARRLVERDSREQLARTLENLVEHAERGPSISIIVPLPRREIREACTLIRTLAERLRDPRPVYARGAALISQLVRDGTGPALTPGAGVALRRALWAAVEALDGTYQDELGAHA